VNDQPHTPATLPVVKGPLYPFNWKVG